jgi:hypothetical protein
MCANFHLIAQKILGDITIGHDDERGGNNDLNEQI